MHRVEAVRLVEEVRRALARATDARQLDHVRRLDPEIEERIDDALGDGIVAATRAQRGLGAAIGRWFQPDDVDLACHGFSRAGLKTRPYTARCPTTCLLVSAARWSAIDRRSAARSSAECCAAWRPAAGCIPA